MGHHDPLDGFITYNELQATAARVHGNSGSTDLHSEIADMADVCKGKNWGTDDPLGIGSLLSDAFRVAQLMVTKDLEEANLLETILESSLAGLDSFVRGDPLTYPAHYRLAFRELGLSIGVRAVGKIRELIEKESRPSRKKDSLRLLLKAFDKYTGLSGAIETFWREDKNRKAESWSAHRDIKGVMLATSLSPDGFLEL